MTQFKTVTPQKQFSGDSRFRLSWSRPCMGFSGDISAIFARNSKIIWPKISANISSRIGWMKSISRTRFFRVCGSLFGVVDIWWVDTAKAHLRNAHLPLAPLVKAFSCRLCTGYRKFHHFGSGSALVNLRMIFFSIAESVSHTFTCLPSKSRRSIVYLWNYCAFQCFSYAWIRLGSIRRFWSD